MIDDGPGPEVTAGVVGGSTVVAITLAADYGQDLEALGRASGPSWPTASAP